MTKQRMWIAVVCLVGASSGCSLLIDTDPYIGERDGGGIEDAGADTGIDPNAPSAPGIELTPASPRTADDLAVAITRESVDPMAEAVTYEYRWYRDEARVESETDPTIAAALTTRDETWTVEVTPVADDGRRGLSSTAEVVIANTPPVLVTVGLTRYAPSVNERVAAITGPVTDADGDSAIVRYRWLRNTALIDDAMSQTIDLISFIEGDRLLLEAWADDGDVGPTVTVGPVQVLADVTRWRELLPGIPQDELVAKRRFFDTPRRRIIQYINGTLWEVPLTERQSLRTAQLFPLGTGPGEISNALVVHDVARERLLVADALDPHLLHVADLSARGAETWTTIASTGVAPPRDQRIETRWYDSATGRHWFYRGRDAALDSVLFSLDLSDPNAPVWTHHALGPDAPALLHAAAISHPSSPDHALLLGGVVTSDSLITATESVWEVDLRADPVRFSMVGNLPEARFGAVALPGPGANDVLFVGGWEGFDDTGANRAFIFDSATGEVSEGAEYDGLRFIFAAARDADDASAYLVVGSDIPFYSDLTLTAARVAIDADTVTAVSRLLRPSGLISPTAYSFGTRFGVAGARYYGGGFFSPDARTEIWEMNPIDDVWSPLIATPDVATSTAPLPRWGVRAQVEYPAGAAPGLLWFGGSTSSTGLADSASWQLDEDGHWFLHQLDPASSDAPTRRTGASIFAASCDSTRDLSLVVVGGQGASSTLLNDTWRLMCEAGRTSCRWESVTVPGVMPSPRTDSAAVVPSLYGPAFLFGGRTSSGDSDELFSVSPCASFESWAEVTASGSSPGPRSGHTLSIIHASKPGLASALLFGGSTTSEQVHRLTFNNATDVTWDELVVAPGTSPGPQRHHAAWWDAPRRRLVILTGDDELWELRVRP